MRREKQEFEGLFVHLIDECTQSAHRKDEGGLVQPCDRGRIRAGAEVVARLRGLQSNFGRAEAGY